ncbi:MAG TPA: endonuclease/exonuclease/phosphatase family protein [Chitinophagales bacterium]|nr:endonuclease/exonuclease/phosphatase family protein [Chitinophagales bacterium]
MTQAKRKRRTASAKGGSSSLPWTQIVIAFIVAIVSGWGYSVWNNGSNQSTEQPSSSESVPPSTTPKPKSNPASSTANSSYEFYKMISWNLYNFSASKSEKAMQQIVQILQDYDLVALQEITTSGAGAQGVADLALRLNEMGSKWDYAISDPTTGDGSERYAFLWKTKHISRLGRAFLSNAKGLANTLDREPYIGKFAVGSQVVTIANFHAIPATKQPQQEVIQLPNLHDAYGNVGALIIAGDFNLSEKHLAFTALKSMGYEAVLHNQKTSIKLVNLEGEYLSQEYDNIFYETSDFKLLQSGVVDFVKNRSDLSAVRELSDHLPVWAKFGVIP